MKESPSFIQLYQRIRRKDTTEYCKSLLLYIILSCLFGLICTPLFYVLNYHNYIFNSWFGSFDFNLTELMTYRSRMIARCLLFDKKYLQVELNQHQFNKTHVIFIEFPKSHQSYSEKCYTNIFILKTYKTDDIYLKYVIADLICIFLIIFKRN